MIKYFKYARYNGGIMHYATLIAAFLLSMILVPLNIWMAQKFSLVDTPNSRSMHKKVIPSSGGIGFVLAVFISLLLFERGHFFDYYYVYLSIVVVWIAGILDDIYNVQPRIKLVFIFVASLLLYQHDFAIYQLGTYFGYHLVLPVFLVFPFTLFAITGYTNAINLIDGIDGLSASVSIVIMLIFFIIGIEQQDALLIFLSSTFISVLLAFLLFNWHPAKIFMGDSGSLVLGFVISILAIESLHYVEPISTLFFLALPLLDILTVMIRRKQRHKPIFSADKMHVHHFIVNMKRDVGYVVYLLAGMQMVYVLIGYQIIHTNEAVSFVLFMILFFLHFNFFDQRIRRRKKRR